MDTEKKIVTFKMAAAPLSTTVFSLPTHQFRLNLVKPLAKVFSFDFNG